MSQSPPHQRVAIDFGNSNTDLVATSNVATSNNEANRGANKGKLHIAHQPYQGLPTGDLVRTLLQSQHIEPSSLSRLAVTGGHHARLPTAIAGLPITPVDEVQAMGRGGQELAGDAPASNQPILIVSAGSGVAFIRAQGAAYQHVTGTGVGGGTLLGLSSLLLGITKPGEIDALAQQGDPNRVDLTLPDVVSGPIGALPPDTTAVNFGRLARSGATYSRADLAAALVTLVGQVVATIAINAARAQQVERIVVVGHLTDMRTMRQAIARTSSFFGMPIETPHPAGHATALGALLSLDYMD